MPDHNPSNRVPKLSLPEITGEIWQELSRQKPGEAPVPPAERARRPASAKLPAPVPAPLPLAALLALDGRAFLDAAYWAVLGRAADDEGTAYAEAQFALGRSKVEVLYQLQSSAEGQLAGRGYPGLRQHYLAHRLYRLPVVGRGARMAGRVLERTGVLALLGHIGGSDTANLAHRLATLEAVQQDMQQTTTAALAEQARLLKALNDRSSQFARQLTAAEDSIIETLLTVSETIASHERRIAGSESVLETQSAAQRIDAAAGALRLALETRVIAAENLAQQNRREILDQQRRIGLMLQAVRHPALPALDVQDDHAMDALYVAFEDRFRGSRADIKDRQRIYVPRLRSAGAGAEGRPVLDIGSGRGEFLELMRDEGLQARGVDLNESMAEACRASGLDCQQGDALLFLAAQPDSSAGAITGFHIIEHLPFKTIVRIMDEALRVLAPGGLLILETPNPANLVTASRYFYLDPTHHHPLPHEMVAMIAEMRGFIEPEVLHLHPMHDSLPGADRVLAGALEQILYGPQDYALIVRTH